MNRTVNRTFSPPDLVIHPAEEPLRLSALAAVLNSASATALRVWQPERVDIYQCAHRAWRAHNIPVPFAAITQALRRVAPECISILDYNDGEGRTRRDIADLFLAARDDVSRQLADTQPASAQQQPPGRHTVHTHRATYTQLPFPHSELPVGA